MKNKRVLYIFLAFFIIVVIVLLSSVLFSVNDAVLAPKQQSVMVDSNNVQSEFSNLIGKNIFFIDVAQITDGIEKNNPYIKVINIERIFPSTVKLHYRERKEVFCLKVGSGFAALDSEGKVLDIRSAQDNILIDIDYSSYNPAVSDFIEDENILSILSLYDAFKSMTSEGKNYDEILFKGYFEKVYSSSSGNNLCINTNFGGEIEIIDFRQQLYSKLYVGLQLFLDELSDLERTYAKVIVNNALEASIMT
ncbi:MAG: FtsQ-type POTRA domain-containing protein [Clostridia bacterium]|nr:FtsQ-type POTRA domain-containing protein [Clostridia bacterium]